ncbi:hypothetical protein BDN70DRAFT_391918 [Pholiota conissans]|uniref:HMA domain-containing protein n=1 Tax=Pholiota conissans TaxID=109636 RepID=A0A9P5Z8Y2_9AGAR|nr:hypothetical protein BDN70DRAFT_391918 [Pholiota conissans]
MTDFSLNPTHPKRPRIAGPQPRLSPPRNHAILDVAPLAGLSSVSVYLINNLHLYLSILLIRKMCEHTYKFDVKMTCSGCSGAVSRVLEKAKADVTSYNVNLDTQEVLVTATLPYDDILARIKKTGKEVRSGTTLV